MRDIISKLFRSFLGVGAVALLLGLSGLNEQAFATVTINSDTSVTITDVGDSFGVDYVCLTTDTCGDAGSPDVILTGMTLWDVTSFTSDTIVFDIEVMNTTNDPGSTNNRITQFGVQILTPDTTNDAASATVDNSGSATDPDWDADTQTTFPVFMNVDLKVFQDSGGNAGVKEGESDTLELTLTNFNGGLAGSLTLEIFPIKWQGVGSGGESFEFAGTLKTPPPTRMPEPASLAMFAFGLLVLGFFARRRRLMAA